MPGGGGGGSSSQSSQSGNEIEDSMFHKFLLSPGMAIEPRDGWDGWDGSWMGWMDGRGWKDGMMQVIDY